MRKTRMEIVEENSRKTPFNTLDKTPILIGSISSQFCGEKPFKRVGKTGSKTLLQSSRKQPPNGPIYRAPKTSRWGLTELSVDRPVDRPTVIFQTVKPSVDRSVDRGQDTESTALCPVDRSVDQGLSREQSSLDGRPGRSTGPPARTGVHICARRSTARSADFRLRSTGRSTG